VTFMTAHRVSLLLAAFTVGCAGPADPYQKIQAFEPEEGMIRSAVTSRLGPPDDFSFTDAWNTAHAWGLSPEFTKLHEDGAWEVIRYGPFAAVGPKGQTVTRYRLNLLMKDGFIYRWRREAAPNDK